MNDKVNVKVIVPEINKSFNVILPINKKIGVIINLLNKGINELSNGDYPLSTTNKLYNVDTLQRYEPNLLLFNSDIRNGTKLVLLTK